MSTWKFSCQHGNNECELNKYHACGIKHAETEAAQIKLVNCLMTQGPTATNYASMVETVRFSELSLILSMPLINW